MKSTMSNSGPRPEGRMSGNESRSDRVFRRNLIIGMTLVFLGALFLLIIIPIGIKVPGHLPKAATSPAMWPQAAAALLLAAGLILTAFVLVDRHLKGPTPGTRPEPLIGNWRLVAGVLIMFVCWGLIPILGLPAVSALALAGFGYLMGTSRPWLLGVLAVVLPAVLYAFFTWAANVPVPLGLFLE